MNDRAKPAQSPEQNGNTPLSQWGSEIGDYQESTDIDDAFAELLEKSPVRSSDGEDPPPADTRPSSDDLPGIDAVSVDEPEQQESTETGPVSVEEPIKEPVVEAAGPDDSTFSLLGYLLESTDDDQIATETAETEVESTEHLDPSVADPSVEDLTEYPDHLDGGMIGDDVPDGLTNPDGAEHLSPDAPQGASAADPVEGDNEPTDAGLVIVERSTIINSSSTGLERMPEPGPEFAPPSQRRPGDLAGSTLYSADDYEGHNDTQENRDLASSFWQEPTSAPAWHPDAPTNLQHSAVVEDEWNTPSLPARSVRSPGERRRPQTALDVVGELTDRPGFWKSVAVAAFLVIGSAFYSIGFFDEAMGRGSEQTATQVVRGEATLPEAELESEPPDALSDLRSALTDDGDLGASSGSGGEDDPAAPSVSTERRGSNDAGGTTTATSPTSAAENSTTTTRETTTAVSDSSTSLSTSTTTTTTTLRSTTTQQPSTTLRSTTTRPATTTTTTEATTTTKKTPPSRGRPATTTTTTTTTTTSSTTATTSTTQPSTTTTTEASTTTTEASTTSTEAGGGE